MNWPRGQSFRLPSVNVQYALTSTTSGGCFMVVGTDGGKRDVKLSKGRGKRTCRELKCIVVHQGRSRKNVAVLFERKENVEKLCLHVEILLVWLVLSRYSWITKRQ